jgi:hypothetical protein
MFINYYFFYRLSVMMAGKTSKKSKVDVQEALIDNFINLQKVLTNLSVKFEDLSGNVSKLLQLFEISAKSFAEGNGKPGGVDKEFLDKLDSLLDQNKTISKGIMMMEEKIRNRHAMPVRHDLSRGFKRPVPRR